VTINTNGNGLYDVLYTPLRSGFYDVDIKMGALHVALSPYVIEIVHGNICVCVWIMVKWELVCVCVCDVCVYVCV